MTPMDADKVRRACLLRGWTQERLAQEAGIGAGTANRIWNGQPTLVRTQLAVSRALAQTRGQIREDMRAFLVEEIA